MREIVMREGICVAKSERFKGIVPFAMEQVKNEDAYCVNALEKEVQYLVSFDVDRLLSGFRENAGLDQKGKKRYNGWENMLIGGHTMGHYLTAMAQAFVNPGVRIEEKKTINSMLDDLLVGLLECQRNSKGKPGFLFGAIIMDPENVELQFDCVEANRIDIFKEAWVPWYTMHKILAGVIEVYKLTGKENALCIAKGLGDWTYNRSGEWDAKLNQKVLSIEYGGMNDCLYELFAITGEEKYAIAAHRFDEESLFEKVLQGSENVLCNIHANTTIPKFMGALNRYYTCHGKMVDGEMVDASKYLEYVEYFWEMVLTRHTYVTGGNSEWEHFREDFALNAKRTNCNCETCNVHNMLKLSRLLFQITGKKKYADYYEQAFVNAILPSQNQETGMSMYFQPMATGYFKVFSSPWDNFWCCTGTGMENFTKLNDSILFHNDRYIFVNLYENVMLQMEEKQVKFTMKAELQKLESVYIKLEQEESIYGLALRIPDWTNHQIRVKVDGVQMTGEEEDGYLFLSANQITGKEICVELAMQMVAKTLPDDERIAAFKYGPFVLSGNLGTKDMVSDLTGVDVTIPAKRVEDYDCISLPEDVDINAFLKDPNPYFQRKDNTEILTFELMMNGLQFQPHYNRYKERYGLYFELS